jgi:uncharacterized membrane protein
MHSPDGPNTQRALSIDIIRGFCLTCMVVIHFMVYFGDTAAMNTWLYFSLNHILGDWGAGGFLMIMGISQALSGQKHTDLKTHLLFKRALIRGGFIFIVGLTMLALAWGPYKIWQWDILTLMGFATIALFFCRFLPSWSILTIAAFIAVSTPFLRGQLAIASIWNNNFMQVSVISSYFPGILLDPSGALPTAWSLKDIVQGFLFTGEFPVFPWLLFPFTGLVLGRRITENKIKRDLPLLLFLGIIFVFLGLGLGYAGSLRPGASIISGYIVPLSFYPDSFSMIFSQLGMSVVVIIILYYLYDIRMTHDRKIGILAGIFTFTSRSSLTFYFLHYLLIGWPLALIYLFSGKYYIYNLMGSLPAFVCGLAAVGVLSLGLKIWEKHGSKYKLEWFLGVLTRRFTSVEASRKSRV